MELLLSSIKLGGNVCFNCFLYSFVVLVSLLTFTVWFRTRRIRRLLSKLPGPPSHFLLGNLDGFLKEYLENGNAGVMKHCYHLNSKYAKNKIMKIWAAWKPTVVLFKAESVESLLTSQDAIGKAFPYKFLYPWLGTGLLTSSGNKWRTRRRLLTPAFHFRILQDFIHVLNEQSMTLVEKFGECTDKTAVNVIPIVERCTLDVICETAMGVQIGAQKNPSLAYADVLMKVGETLLSRCFSPWTWNEFLFTLCPSGKRHSFNLSTLKAFTMKVIQERKRLMVSQRKETRNLDNVGNIYIGRKRRECFLDLLLHHHLDDGSLSEEDIREEVDTFMFEGYDTTAVGISWALYNIGLYPDIQRNVQEELVTIFGEDTKRSVTCDDLKEMKYLECVIKESQRLFPSVPFIGRELTTDLEVPSVGVTLPEGTTVVAPIFFLHRDEEVFPNPEKFDPDRFLPENVHNRSPFAYIPFSAGPRNCIGQRFAMMEEKVVVSNVLRHFSVCSVDSPKSLNLLPEMVLRSGGGVKIGFREKVKS